MVRTRLNVNIKKTKYTKSSRSIVQGENIQPQSPKSLSVQDFTYLRSSVNTDKKPTVHYLWPKQSTPKTRSEKYPMSRMHGRGVNG